MLRHLSKLNDFAAWPKNLTSAIITEERVWFTGDHWKAYYCAQIRQRFRL